ncbi:MFS transporter [Microbacterium sp. LRZ72]|uniref:MFS transporter n=1 Tax=Microbacterium sp. LRZ72 TaxID=2942481 RepID=UPI0029BB976D|nr:MFS transporter [Microbacterium sp. LRZ72]MDX2377201.1 MFS transporter [Microbacterium sp. LRZ72]
MTSAPAARPGRRIPWLIVAGVLVAALSLRGPIVAPTPVLLDIQDDMDVGGAVVGLLTTVPVLMFAVLTPVAALVIRRSGAEIALLASLAGVLIGTFVRALPGFGWMLVGSLVIGGAITVGNVVIPVIIRRDVPPARVSAVTAGYVSMLNAGSLLTSLATAPLAAAIGWSPALVTWSVVTAAGLALWLVHLRRTRVGGAGERFSGLSAAPSGSSRGPAPAAGRAARTETAGTLTGPLPAVGARGERSMLRRPVTWLLMLAFAMQTTAYYALTTWLPTILQDDLGVDPAAAGALASIFHGVAIAGAFLVPVLTRYFPTAVPAAIVCLSWVLLAAGMLWLPSAFVLWAIFGALAHSGGFVVIFTALVGVARSDREAAGMSAFVQGGGYAVGAVGAPLMGALREGTGSWDAPLALVLAVTLAYSVLLLTAVGQTRRG